MKVITCYHCDKKFQSDSSKDILNQMLPHYTADHAEVMKSNSKEDREKWMIQFNKDWEAQK